MLSPLRASGWRPYWHDHLLHTPDVHRGDLLCPLFMMIPSRHFSGASAPRLFHASGAQECGFRTEEWIPLADDPHHRLYRRFCARHRCKAWSRLCHHNIFASRFHQGPAMRMPSWGTIVMALVIVDPVLRSFATLCRITQTGLVEWPVCSFMPYFPALTGIFSSLSGISFQTNLRRS